MLRTGCSVTPRRSMARAAMAPACADARRAVALRAAGCATSAARSARRVVLSERCEPQAGGRARGAAADDRPAVAPMNLVEQTEARESGADLSVPPRVIEEVVATADTHHATVPGTIPCVTAVQNRVAVLVERTHRRA